MAPPHSLAAFVTDFALGIKLADGSGCQALNARTGVAFQPGIGPHSETETVRLIMAALETHQPARYAGQWQCGIPYPEQRRQKCDLCLGRAPRWQWAIEVKMLRFLGDNGKPNDNILMHLLSPYPAHRSALTDCPKLSSSALAERKAVLIYGYDQDEWPLDPAIDAFETLAQRYIPVGQREVASFSDLVHPVHSRGRVFGWELAGQQPAG